MALAADEGNIQLPPQERDYADIQESTRRIPRLGGSRAAALCPDGTVLRGAVGRVIRRVMPFFTCPKYVFIYIYRILQNLLH